jgi:membrane associated rhomboid family serine protease
VSDTAPGTRDRRFDGVLLLLAIVVVMWMLEVIDAVAPGTPLDRYGIEPRDPDSLPEVATAPFLHVGFGHLIGNTIPLIAMGTVIALQGAARLAFVTLIVIAVSGIGIWLVAPEHTTHLGASGIVFGYAAYLLARGIFNRAPLELAVGAVVALVWGTALLGGLAPQDGVSWQGHLFGAVGGVIAARVFARPRSARGRGEPTRA